MKDLQIVPLQNTDASALRRLLSQDPPSYGQYFKPFAVSLESITQVLNQAKLDQYWGIRIGAELIAFFMLRGLDAGYAIPSFGIYTAQAFSSNGLAKVALHYALSWCRLNKYKEIMLSVHPDNVHASRVYEQAGFVFTEKTSPNGHRILQKTLSMES